MTPDRVLTCLAYDTETGTCTSEAWVQPPEFLPALSVEDATAIATAALLAFAAVVAVKLAFRKTQ